MTHSALYDALDATGIRREADAVVPINGKVVSLPYLVVRSKEHLSMSDNGRVGTQKTEWGVALFSANRDQALEALLVKALRPAGKLEIIRYPDGAPYQTTFKFTTCEVVR